MGEDSDSGAGRSQLDGDRRPSDAARLAALAELVPALAHRLNNGLLPVVGLGELVQTQPDSPALARIAATADDRGRMVVRSIKALSELAKPAVEGATRLDARSALDAAELLLDPLAEARAIQLRWTAPEELPTEVDGRALVHWLVVCGVNALAAEDPRLAIAVRRRGAHWSVDVVGTRGSDAGAGGLAPQRSRGRVHRYRLELPAFGKPAEARGEAQAQGPRVLLFERDPELAELLEAVLGEAGYTPRLAVDAAAAEALVDELAFDLLLLSPGASARDQLADLELAERLRPRIGSAVGVIGPEAVATRLGAPRALPRDFRPGDLLAYLDELLSADGSERTRRGSSSSSCT